MGGLKKKKLDERVVGWLPLLATGSSSLVPILASKSTTETKTKRSPYLVTT